MPHDRGRVARRPPLPLVRAGADRIGQVRDAPTARLPGLGLTPERRFLHGFLAEYDRTLIVAPEGRDLRPARRVDQAR